MHVVTIVTSTSTTSLGSLQYGVYEVKYSCTQWHDIGRLLVVLRLASEVARSDGCTLPNESRPRGDFFPAETSTILLVTATQGALVFTSLAVSLRTTSCRCILTVGTRVVTANVFRFVFEVVKLRPRRDHITAIPPPVPFLRWYQPVLRSPGSPINEVTQTLTKKQKYLKH